MNMLPLRLAILCLLAFILSGCGQARDLWSKTTGYYEAHIDPKPEINLERGSGLSKKETHLAVQFSAMDQELELLLRTLAPQDTFPSQTWFTGTLNRFPWLNAILAVDTQGRPLAQHPEASLKPIQVEPLLDREWSIIKRGLQGFVQETPLGLELIIAGPFFRDGIWQGLIVAHFDPRSLISLAPDPESLVLFAPGQLLWTGLDDSTSRRIVDAPWEDILRNRIQGRGTTDTEAYAWLSRPLGDLRLVYAVTLQ